MKRSALAVALPFGLLIGLLLAGVQVARMAWWPPRALEGFAAVVGLLFLLVGVAVGLRLRQRHHSAAGSGDSTLPTECGHDLTRREREVLQRLAEGCSNSEIAARHFVSENTVKTQVRQICAKLDARSRLHAVARAREVGLLR
jgi:DNA-binding CsgD family transcriptional regulator